MNKKQTASAIASFLLLTSLSVASAEQYAAIDESGVCKLFDTTKDIPDTSKHVSSCEDTQAQTRKGLTPAQWQERRNHIRDYQKSRYASTAKASDRITRTQRIGSGTWTRGTAARSRRLPTHETNENKSLKRRTFSASTEYYQKLLKRRQLKSKNNNNSTRPAIASRVGEIKRTGGFESKPKYSTELEFRSNKKAYRRYNTRSYLHENRKEKTERTPYVNIYRGEK